MTRLGFGLGFGKQTAMGLGGGTEILNANVADFDGATDFVDLGVLTSPTGNAECCVVGRFKSPAHGSSQFIFSNTTNTQTGANIDIYLDPSGKMQVGYGPNGGDQTIYPTVDSFNGNAWHTFIIMFDNVTSAPKVYVDTNVERSFGTPNLNGSIIGKAFTFSDPASIGRRNFTGSFLYWQGSICFLDYRVGNMTSDQRDIVFDNPSALCWDRYVEEGLDTDSRGYYYLGNWTGTTGEEFVDQSGTNADGVDGGSLEFTDTYQVECEA